MSIKIAQLLQLHNWGHTTQGPNGGVWAPMRSATTKIAQCILENLVDGNKLDSIDSNEGIIDGEVEFQTGFDAGGKDNFKVEIW